MTNILSIVSELVYTEFNDVSDINLSVNWIIRMQE